MRGSQSSALSPTDLLYSTSDNLSIISSRIIDDALMPPRQSSQIILREDPPWEKEYQEWQ